MLQKIQPIKIPEESCYILVGITPNITINSTRCIDYVGHCFSMTQHKLVMKGFLMAYHGILYPNCHLNFLDFAYMLRGSRVYQDNLLFH